MPLKPWSAGLRTPLFGLPVGFGNPALQTNDEENSKRMRVKPDRSDLDACGEETAANRQCGVVVAGSHIMPTDEPVGRRKLEQGTLE